MIDDTRLTKPLDREMWKSQMHRNAGRQVAKYVCCLFVCFLHFFVQTIGSRMANVVYVRYG
jgi:hypothetical protein